ncbi:MAG: hypothetical protein ACQCN3_00745 [Candidatus Bathyarchaeia archaeon]|jgi:hypothetical protein
MEQIKSLIQKAKTDKNILYIAAVIIAAIVIFLALRGKKELSGKVDA